MVLRTVPETRKGSLLKAPSDPALLPLMQQQHGGKKRPLEPTPKRVSFGHQQVFYRSRREQRAKIKTLWYSDDDFANFKSLHLQEAKLVANSKRPECTGAIHQAFAVCLDEEGNNKLNRKQFVNLCKTLEDPEFTGVEGFAAREVFRDKKARRQMLVQIVNEIQEYERHEKIQTQPGLLRLACEKISRPSVLFARNIASATAASCR